MAVASKTKAAPKASERSVPSPETPKFELPKFEIPSLDLARFEVPATFRELADKGLAQAKDNYEKVKAVAEEATVLIEDGYATCAKGTTDFGLKVIEAARANANAAFDFATEALTARSLSELIELTGAHTRRQVDAVLGQSKELAAIAQKMAVEATQPLRAGVDKAFKLV
jgi:phasin